MFKDYHFTFEREGADQTRFVIWHEDDTGAKCVEEVIMFDMSANFEAMRDAALTCVWPGTIDQFNRSFERDRDAYKAMPEKWQAASDYYQTRIDEYWPIED